MKKAQSSRNPKSVVPVFSCRGCGRTDLTADEMGKDRSKPSGLHSRCKVCQEATRERRRPTKLVSLPTPPPRPELTLEAICRREALLLLVKRHPDEFRDLLIMERYRRRPNPNSKDDAKKTWVSAGRI